MRRHRNSFELAFPICPSEQGPLVGCAALSHPTALFSGDAVKLPTAAVGWVEPKAKPTVLVRQATQGQRFDRRKFGVLKLFRGCWVMSDCWAAAGGPLVGFAALYPPYMFCGRR